MNSGVNFDPETYMRLAIEEMNKSHNEPRMDGKIPPKVGAIILFSDGRVVRAHRGELREGDHAEYTLMERKLGHEKLDNCILFSTLEPCVKRSPPKIGCSKRTINARIKTVYVGIQDPDPTVAGKGIKRMEDNEIRVIMFNRELQKIIEDENRKFLIQARERSKLKEKGEVLSGLEKIIATADFIEFSTDALEKFITEGNLDFKIEETEFKDYLINLGILQYHNRTDIIRPTGMGILLFGKNPRTFFPQASLKASVDFGNDNIEIQEFSSALVLIPNQIENWLKKVLLHSKDTTSFKREDIPNFPLPILREVIINALIHRDYSIEGASSSLKIDKDKIVISSPGSPVPSISMEQLNSFSAPSIQRNPIISYIFSLMNYAEETGFGMQSLKTLDAKYGFPLPYYQLELPFLTLTLPRSYESLVKLSPSTNLSLLNNDELKGYDYIRTRQKVKRRDYQQHFNIESQKKAERHLKKMVDLKLIIRKGSGPSTYYQVSLI